MRFVMKLLEKHKINEWKNVVYTVYGNNIFLFRWELHMLKAYN